MGSTYHHHARATEFLLRADGAISAHDPVEASAALRRAASHITTALAVLGQWKHRSQRQLEQVIHVAISCDHLGRTHLKTFRQAHRLSLSMASGSMSSGLTASGTRGRFRRSRTGPRTRDTDPGIPLRRMRRRVASLITHIVAILVGQPRPVQRRVSWRSQLKQPAPVRFSHVQDILGLPDFTMIRQRFRLERIPLAGEPDPHGWYERGTAPSRCSCHAELWDKPRNPNRITLSPPWRKALENTFRITPPQPPHPRLLTSSPADESPGLTRPAIAPLGWVNHATAHAP